MSAAAQLITMIDVLGGHFYGERHESYALVMAEGAGAHGIYDGFPLQRIFRDVHAGADHVQFREDINYPTWGPRVRGEVAKNLL